MNSCLSLPLALALLTTTSFSQSNSATSPKPTASAVTSARSDRVCPWLTEGSAARALGGDVHLTVSLTNPKEGFCTFVRPEVPLDELKVIVGGVNIPSCPVGSAKVVGVGGQASRCRLTRSAKEVTDMVSGKVRNANFTITFSRNGAAVSTKSVTLKAGAIEEIAEQVAGNLF
jgi:hypothetical protein